MNKSMDQIALLIDADNISLKSLHPTIEKLSKIGFIVIKRAYGNWNKPCLKHWSKILDNFSIEKIQQDDYVKGKNATDIALAIDAIHINFVEQIDTFAIISSDSDFTPLATKFRQNGKNVIGVGEPKTSKYYVESCNDFIFINLINTLIKPLENREVINLSKGWHYSKGRIQIDKRN